MVQVPKNEGQKPKTVRLLAPQFYRKYLPGVVSEDTPKTVITAWAQALGCQVAVLTGGNWQMLSHPHGKILVGHVSVSQELADHVVRLSGHNALFATLVDKH